MEVITLQSEAWDSINRKMDEIQEEIKKSKKQEWENRWIDNETFIQRLGISRKTAQNYRDQRLISFSQVGNKIYYRNKDVEEFLLKNHIKCKGGNL